MDARMAIRCCSRTAGAAAKDLSRTSGTPIASWACCTCWPSVRPPIPISPESWYAWQRPFYQYGKYQFISGGPLFTHQYSQAWIDFRNRRDRGFVDFFLNSVNATRANQQYSFNWICPTTFGKDIWGITASDGPKGYRIYGEIKAFDPVDGTVAPAAAGGSLMFTPDISIPALKAMQEHFGDRVFGRYGFVDGYNPTLELVRYRRGRHRRRHHAAERRKSADRQRLAMVHGQRTGIARHGSDRIQRAPGKEVRPRK